MTPVEETDLNVTMAAASSVLLDAYEKLSPEQRALLQRGVQTGKLRIVIDQPPLAVHINVVDSQNEHQQCLVAVEDDRSKWFGWLRDLFTPMQGQ